MLPIECRIAFVFDLLDRTEGKLGKCISAFVIVIILLSVFGFCLETDENFTDHPKECAEKIAQGVPVTEDDCRPVPTAFFDILEVLCVTIFTVEYLPRVLCVHAWKYTPPHVQELAPDHRAPSWYVPGNGLRTTLYYILDPMNLVDLMAIFPFYLELVADRGRGPRADHIILIQ